MKQFDDFFKQEMQKKRIKSLNAIPNKYKKKPLQKLARPSQTAYKAQKQPDTSNVGNKVNSIDSNYRSSQTFIPRG